MAIRTKKYWTSAQLGVYRAVQITEKNLAEVVSYISRNGGIATGHNARPEFKRPARIRIKQLTFGKNWSKNDWRVAAIGDFIVRDENDNFFRVKQADFFRDYAPASK
ncbi:hypothetical protein PBI_COUNT_97 [Microbacterium phage Count]|nr:hypothetical protein PBI_COUNT_97 [Microbacterium phage Count]